ncbi:cysteine desulfurase [Bacilli bacterium PM5-3]|nr:cysteine desulfurase [Bacilli bacterium PM5-3]MDH6603860.1 cysteine desulfurase [Bacilli bacterium PM5-9]
MIYLDNAATTKVNSDVLNTLYKLYDEYFMNADSPYLPASNIHDLQEQARSNLAKLLKVNNDELIFTSCGSEANNMAIKGIAYKFLDKKNKHIITSMIEHSSVYETMKQLEEFGYSITYLKPNKFGKIENSDILNAIREDTILISVMKINSELGSINELESIYDEIKRINSDIIVHCDCVQAFGKYDLNLNQFDLTSFSAHKINGVKGSGLLYKKRKVNLIPLLSGGQQEFNLRAGTSSYQQNIVLAKTLRLYLEKREDINLKERYEYIYNLLENDARINVNSSKENNSFFIINFSIPNYKPEVILNALEKDEIYISTKSACSSNVKRSRVIDSLDILDEYKDSAFRISFDLDTTIGELDKFYQKLNDCLNMIMKG